MLAAMVDEIRVKGSVGRLHESNQISTIYFGGGTPSLLSPVELALLMNTIRENFNVDADAEITFEANPENISPGNLLSWLSAGINRLSVGVQSFIDKDLIWMNRVHNASQSEAALRDIKEAGFKNYSIDLIFGMPTLTDDNWRRNVETVHSYAVPHIAAYALTVEPSTALQRMIETNKKEMVDPEKQADQFLILMEWMEENGYEHYEISNFCKPGQRSKHNSNYWNGTPYIGIGPSAHSYNGIMRSWNISNNSMYISSVKSLEPYGSETLTTIQRLNEYIMTSLRTVEGLNLDYVNDCFGSIYSDKLDQSLSIYQQRSQMLDEKGRLVLTKQGKLFADGIAAELFF